MKSPDRDESVETYDERRLRLSRLAIEKFKKMTPDQKFQTYIDAGIYTQDRRLRKEYGGDA